MWKKRKKKKQKYHGIPSLSSSSQAASPEK
jgi:hypothetical protein